MSGLSHQRPWIASKSCERLAAFVRSLEPPPCLPPCDFAAVDAGRKVDELGCRHCHAPPSFKSPGRFDVGTKDENGHHEFNPPSLRGIAHRDGFLLHNRAETLADAFASIATNCREH